MKSRHDQEVHPTWAWTSVHDRLGPHTAPSKTESSRPRARSSDIATRQTLESKARKSASIQGGSKKKKKTTGGRRSESPVTDPKKPRNSAVKPNLRSGIFPAADWHGQRPNLQSEPRNVAFGNLDRRPSIAAPRRRWRCDGPATGPVGKTKSFKTAFKPRTAPRSIFRTKPEHVFIDSFVGLTNKAKPADLRSRFECLRPPSTNAAVKQLFQGKGSPSFGRGGAGKNRGNDKRTAVVRWPYNVPDQKALILRLRRWCSSTPQRDGHRVAFNRAFCEVPGNQSWKGASTVREPF